MIKIIAFDFVGVLVNEKDVELSDIEVQLERMFGPNINDSDYLIKANSLIDNVSDIINTTELLINKIYKIRDKHLFEKIKRRYKNIKIIVATNHLSFVKKFIIDNFGTIYLDDIIISAEISKIKPNADFYEYILNQYNITPRELLFIDDNIDNIKSANNLNINTIKVEKSTNLFSEIIKVIDNDWLLNNISKKNI